MFEDIHGFHGTLFLRIAAHFQATNQNEDNL